MKVLGMNQFDQCVLNISLINLCDGESYVGQELRKNSREWRNGSDEPMQNPWLDLHQFTIYVPHPDQEYEGITLEAGLTRGYNVETKPVQDRSQIPYHIPPGGHFVVVLKQEAVDGEFSVAATGIFVRPLAVLHLDIIVDLHKPEYYSIAIKHPIIRDYPTGWEEKLKHFLNQDIRGEDLPNLVNYVDQTLNEDYRPPSWNEVSLAAKGFAGV